MTNSSLEDIMNDLRAGERRSNLRDINLEEEHPLQMHKFIANMLNVSGDMSHQEYRLNFDPAQEIVLRRLVKPEMLEKRLIVVAEDFFKSIISIDYYCSTITRSHEVVYELYDFAKKLERQDRSLDPTLSQIIEHLTSDSLKYMNISDMRSRIGAWRRTYNSLNEEVNLDNSSILSISPIYLEAGKLVASCITGLQQYVYNIKGRQDIKALIFTDSVYIGIENQDVKHAIEKQLGEKDYLKASLLAIYAASKEHYDKSFQKLIGDIT